MYRRMLGLSLLFCMLVSFVSPEISAAEPNASPPSAGSNQASPTSFIDVQPTDWFYDAVAYVQQNGIFGGTDLDRFSPDGSMTRAMYVTVLGRMAGVDVSPYSTSSFADVRAGAWYAPYVQWAAESGITSGTGIHQFSPDAAVSREQMATLTVRYFERYHIPYETNGGIASQPNDITDISPWAVEAVVKLWQAGLLTGDADGNFNPNAHASRAEAAVFFMCNNEVVKAWTNQEQASEPPASPSLPPSTTDPNAGGGSGNGSSGTAPVTYTITFVTDGSADSSLSYTRGAKLNPLPAPIKSGFIFVGWYTDSALSHPVDPDTAVNSDMTLYAKYEEASHETQVIPSVSKLDQTPSFTIQVDDATGSMTADEVKAGMTFEAPSEPDFVTRVGIQVTGSDGLFTVGANGGAFDEGGTYRLQLTNSNLTFAGEDESTTAYVFTIAKQEVQNVTLNPDLVYIPASEITNMTQNAAIPVVSMKVGVNGASQTTGGAAGGTFQYNGDLNLQVGNTVAIYTGIAPNERNLTTSSEDDGEVAYVTIREIDGNAYTYGEADAKKVLFTPDVLPVSQTADTDGDPDNHAITVSKSTMDYSDGSYAHLGLTASTVVQAGDFIAFYTGAFGDASSTLASYAKIAAVQSFGDDYVIAYTDATLEDAKASMDYYTKQSIEGEQLLENTNVAAMEARIEKQAVASGFVDHATDYLATLAMDTDSFKKLGDFDHAVTLTDSNRVEVENVMVTADIGTDLKHFTNESGLIAALQVSCDIVIDAGDRREIVIHLSGTFEQEVALAFSADADTEWDWWGIFPYISDYNVSPTIDASTYTAVQFDAEMGTFEQGEEWDWEDSGKVQNIARQIKDLMDAAGDVLDGVDPIDSSLPGLYQDMLSQESDWVDLFDVQLIDQSVRLLMGVVQVEFKADFVVSANANLSVGCIFSYENGKRYMFNVKLFSKQVSNSTVTLHEEQYQFTFYIMGTVGLRAGLRLELAASLFSTDLDSVGFEADVGAYVNLWGYFYYQLSYTASSGKTSHNAGALYLEFGVYTEVRFKAQLLKGTFSYEPVLYEKEWPLLTAGSPENVIDFTSVA